VADGTTLFGQLSERRRVRDGGLVIDIYAGGGGASLGLEAGLGRPVDIAVNHCVRTTA
jgi:DNA (cytosine-5)-methyltransferase 1